MPFFLCPACGESSFSDVDSFLLHRAMYCRKVRENEDLSRERQEKENLPEAALMMDGSAADMSLDNKSKNTEGEQNQVDTSDTDGRYAKSAGSDPDTISAALSKVVIQVGFCWCFGPSLFCGCPPGVFSVCPVLSVTMGIFGWW